MKLQINSNILNKIYKSNLKKKINWRIYKINHRNWREKNQHQTEGYQATRTVRGRRSCQYNSNTTMKTIVWTPKSPSRSRPNGAGRDHTLVHVFLILIIFFKLLQCPKINLIITQKKQIIMKRPKHSGM